MNKAIILFSTLALLVVIGWEGMPTVNAQDYNVEGRYKRIKPARPLEQTDKVEVVDVFWYGCGGCFRFLPHLQDWEQGKPEYVELRRVPAVWHKDSPVHARAYYTARILGVDDELHVPVFKAMHVDKRSLNTRSEITAFFVEHGVSETEFNDTYDSFTMDSMARESEVMPRRWGVQSTPTVIVNGRYLVDSRTAGSFVDMIKVVEVLVEREHKAMAERSASGG